MRKATGIPQQKDREHLHIQHLSNQPFYIILNLAVGGSWVGNPNEETSFVNNPFVVDYVRVYQKDSYDENVTRPEVKFEPTNEPDESWKLY